MGSFALFGVILGLILLAGAVMGWIAFFQINIMASRLDKLERQIKSLGQVPTAASTNTASVEQPAQPSEQHEPATPTPDEIPTEPNIAAATRSLIASPPTISAAPRSPAVTPPAASHGFMPQNAVQQKLASSIRAHWMVWLGGICIGFAGIFLAKHSVEQGLLGPAARIALTIITALIFHGAAEYLRRTKGQSDVFAALAGGASIMLYAALLACLHLYQLFSPAVAFALLIGVSLATMLLALRHGPVLAAIGILGAFSVPILVNTGSNNIQEALLYSFIITVSALLLIRYVFRPWLWFGTLVGAVGWWIIGLLNAKDIPLALNFYLIFLTYAAIAIHRWDWLLGRHPAASDGLHCFAAFKHINDPKGRLAFLCVLIAVLHALNIAVDSVGYHWLIMAPSLPLLFFWIAHRNPTFSLLPWWVLVCLLCALLLPGLTIGPTGLLGSSGGEYPPLLWVLLQLSALFVILSLWLLRVGSYKWVWATLAFLSPPLLIAVGYLRIEAFSTDWRWALGTGGLGAIYLGLVLRLQSRAQTLQTAQTPAMIVSLTLAAHLACSLALVMLLREATLSLALAVQVISLTGLHRRFPYKALEITTKVVLALVLLRLTLNPWLLTYPTDVHWSLWTYGGALTCCLVAVRLAAHAPLKQWLIGASMHLFLLLLIFEVRYWLYDGHVFVGAYSFTEAAINTFIWGATGLIYYWRARFSQALFRLYRFAAGALLLLSLTHFGGLIVLLKNPLFSATSVSATPVFNILLLAYGMPVILFATAYRILEPPYKKAAGILAGLALLLFCSLEVRHLWHGNLSLSSATSDGELYTYSMVWLALAVAGSIWAIRFSHKRLYKGSMLLLIAVVAKIFLIDMDGLTGLLRAASFMGLGLSLLGLAYLHQQLQQSHTDSARSPEVNSAENGSGPL